MWDSVEELRNGLSNPSFRPAVALGLATVPFTIALSVHTDSRGTVEATAILLAGIVVGYFYSDRPVASRRAGAQVGFVASIGTVAYQVLYVHSTAQTTTSPLVPLFVALTPLYALVGVGLSVLAGVIGSIVGEWIYRKRAAFSGG